MNEFTCEKCFLDYFTGLTWEDECYCAQCYHDMHGCPEWCQWSDCLEGLE